MTSRSGGPWAATASCPCGWCAAPVMPSPSDRPLRLIARGPVPGRRRGRAARQPRNPDGPSSTGMPHNGLMGARTPRITVVGSLNQDITVTVSRFPEPGETLIGTSVSYRLGGKGANQAVADRGADQRLPGFGESTHGHGDVLIQGPDNGDAGRPGFHEPIVWHPGAA